jgi:transcriptional regulator with GAF, ATPase, and Fis domain
MAPPPDTRETAPNAPDIYEIPRIEFVVERENGASCSRRFVSDMDLVRIGSHGSNDVVLTDPLVSRFHCRVARHAHGWRLTDTGSLNGTRLCAVPVRDADLVFPECRIEIGTSTIRVRETGATAADSMSKGLSCGALYGQSACMRRLFHTIARIAKTDVAVLIDGETGTGKELVAAEIVQRSLRRDKPLVIVDCGAIPTNLVESELFGHARGAFTGAHQARVGAFEQADGGTVFLDEVGELPLEMQPKLLRVLAQHEIRRMGENHVRPVNVRVIAATNRQLEREVNDSRFREDLYFRLAVVTLHVPPLRDRPEDIPLLVDHFLESMGALDRRGLFTPDLLALMAKHSWPGNVRELRNIVERTVLSEVVELDEAPPSPSGPAAGPEVDIEIPFKTAKDRLVSNFERRYLTDLLAWAQGNISKAARKAGLDRMYVHRMLHRYGIARADGGALGASIPPPDNDS